MIEINLPPENFLKVKETLTRMGIASNAKKTLYQSCHILHKDNKYYIVHFKEMFKLDGKIIDIPQEDYERTESIANMLQSWNLLSIVNPTGNHTEKLYRILGYKESEDWTLVSKYDFT